MEITMPEEEKKTTTTQATTATEKQNIVQAEAAKAQTGEKQDNSSSTGTLVSQISKKNMLDVYDEIVKYRISSEQTKTPIGGEGEDKELVNILNNYRWTVDSSRSKGTDSFSGNVPFVRINEFKQLYSSQLTNTINSIMSIENLNIDALGDAAVDIGEGVINSLKSITGSLVNSSEAASG